MLDTLRTDMLAVLERKRSALYSQPHPELSPLAWHVGHAVHVEQYWLCERVLGEPADAVARGVYFPEYTPKVARAAQLPALHDLQAELQHKAARLAAAWKRAPTAHGVISSGYLRAFIAQHYAQHLETVAMADHAMRIARGADRIVLKLSDADPDKSFDWCDVPRQQLALGRLRDCGTPAPYDNELGAHRAEVEPCALAAKPVSNRQWLGFMAAGGYTQRALWDDVGWTWRERNAVTAPWGWQRQASQITVCQAWPQSAALDAPVVGISQHEAQAYARWCGAALPHEHSWLAARQAGVLESVGEVWEWCSNPLYTYPGFVAFPYARYTLPWCDGQHWVLKGGSRMTRTPIQRPHFRNFYAAQHRHIFAGLRLCRLT